MLLECEEKSGKIATPCCAHPITGLGEDTEPRGGTFRGVPIRDIQFSEPFEIRVMEWQKWLREAGQEILSHC